MTDIADLVPGVKHDVLYRTGWTLASSCPAQARPENPEIASVDLRSQSENPKPETVSEFAIDVPNIAALLGKRPGIAEYSSLYSAILEVSGPQIAATANLLADSPRVVIGCSLGKDRTGVVIALLLRAVGVPLTDILRADRAAMSRTIGCDQSIRTYAQDRGMDSIELIRRCKVGQDPLRMALESLEGTSGGADSYLRRHGMHPTSDQTLREKLLQ